MGSTKISGYHIVGRHGRSNTPGLASTMEVSQEPNLQFLTRVKILLYSMTTLLDHRTTLAYLAYLGYPDEPRASALQVTRARKIDRRKGKVTRNVFLCYVCGAAGSGKTSLLRAFAGKPFTPIYEPTNKMISVVNSVDIDGSEKYLIVRTAGLILLNSVADCFVDRL